MKRTPNIIFIFPDQLGANHLGCYGNASVSTPNLDAFAERALVYDRAYTSSPVCTPYRGVLFTGRYPTTNGVVENGMRLPDATGPTLATLLNEAGYRTSYLGKWHLSGDPQANRWVPPERRAGFSEFTGWESHHVDHWKGRIWTDDLSDDTPQPRELPMPGHETDALTGLAVEKLGELAARSDPFCLVVAYQAPHPPCSPPPEFAALYEGASPRRPNLPDSPPDYDKPAWDARYPNAEFWRRYWGEVSHLDAAMGRLFAAIEELGLFESSVVVFTSDHGELAGCHGRYGKFVMYEESVRVPLLVSVPGAPSGGAGTHADGGVARTEELFSTVDFLPTFAELAGAHAPDDLPGVSQASRWKRLADGAADGPAPRNEVFMEYRDRAVLDGRFKLIVPGPRVRPDDHSSSASPRELYDLERDPFELENLAGRRELEAVERRLEDRLRVWEASL